MMGEDFRRSMMRRSLNETKINHKHCKALGQENAKTWSDYELKVGHRKLSDFLTTFRSNEPYFPIGNLKDATINSWFSRFFIGYVLVFIMLSFSCAIILIPFKCWGNAWNGVLSNPYAAFSRLSDADNISQKQKLTKIKKMLKAIPLLEIIAKVKHFLALLVLLFFMLSSYFILSTNFG
jgi:hypothetical protein